MGLCYCVKCHSNLERQAVITHNHNLSEEFPVFLQKNEIIRKFQIALENHISKRLIESFVILTSKNTKKIDI